MPAPWFNRGIGAWEDAAFCRLYLLDSGSMDFPRISLHQQSPLLELCLPKWQTAMAACFHFELLVRLLAQKFFAGESVTRDVADGRKGDGLLTLLFGRLEFSSDERLFLPKCNTLRNKLIHCEPDALLRVVRELAPEFTPRSMVRRLTLEEQASGAQILAAIQTQDGAVDVMNTTSRADGFLGWMIQSASDGTFELATELLRRGMVMVDSKTMAG